jgi:hypothetical protein
VYGPIAKSSREKISKGGNMPVKKKAAKKAKKAAKK